MTAKSPPPYVSSQARELNFSTGQPPDTGILSYFHILRKRKWILLLCVGIALIIAFYINGSQKPVYQSSAEIILQPKETQNSPSGTAVRDIMQDPTFMITQARLIQSHAMAERILKKVEYPENRSSLLACFLIRPSGSRGSQLVFSEMEKEMLLRAIPRSLSASQVQRTRMMAISTTCYDHKGVALLADAASESYVELNYESQVEAFQQSFSVISKSLADIREKIKTGEIAIQKVDSEAKLLEALKLYEVKHPAVIELRAKISELSQKLNDEARNLNKMQFTQRRDLIPLLIQPHSTFEELSAIQEDLMTLKPILEQEVSTNHEMYNSMFKRLQEIELSGGNTWVDAKVVEKAYVPSSPIRPNKKMNLIIAMAIGLFIGIGLAFFLEYLDSSIRNFDDVRNYLRLFPLGMVPHVRFEDGIQARSEKDKNSGQGTRPFWLTSDMGVPLYVAEAYRIIRTNLSFGSADEALKVLQVTSAVKGEGKTTTAANLGMSLAQAGMKTLLVDADMRRPSLHRIFGLHGIEAGLSEVLANGKAWESVVEPTGTQNLFCLSAGRIPPNPAELLTSKRLRTLIEEFNSHYDMVIFDSPPVISVADASVIASQVNGIILVTRCGFIPRHLSYQAKSTLEAVHGKVIGCVLNSIQSEHQPYYYYRYYHKYGDYYGETKKSSKGGAASGSRTPFFTKMDALKDPVRISAAALWSRWLRLWKGEKGLSKGSSSKMSDGSG